MTMNYIVLLSISNQPQCGGQSTQKLAYSGDARYGKAVNLDTLAILLRRKLFAALSGQNGDIMSLFAEFQADPQRLLFGPTGNGIKLVNQRKYADWILFCIGHFSIQ